MFGKVDEEILGGFEVGLEVKVLTVNKLLVDHLVEPAECFWILRSDDEFLLPDFETDRVVVQLPCEDGVPFLIDHNKIMRNKYDNFINTPVTKELLF